MGEVPQFQKPPARPAMYCAGAALPAERAPTVSFCFPLPAALVLTVAPGRWMPTLHGVRVDVADGEVAIGGFDLMETYATRQVFDQAVRFLDCVAPRGGEGVMPEAITAQLLCQSDPERPVLFEIVLNARITIAQRERWYVKPMVCA